MKNSKLKKIICGALLCSTFAMPYMDSVEAAKSQDIKAEAQQMFSKAVVYIRRALAGDSNNIYCYENLSAVYYIMNSLEVARLVCEQAFIKYNEYND